MDIIFPFTIFFVSIRVLMFPESNVTVLKSRRKYETDFIGQKILEIYYIKYAFQS